MGLERINCKYSECWDTCRVEKMGCPGCYYYFKQLYELDDEEKTDTNIWKKKEIKN